MMIHAPIERLIELFRPFAALFSDSVRYDFKESGVSAFGIDPPHCVLTFVEFRPEAFSEYDCKERNIWIDPMEVTRFLESIRKSVGKTAKVSMEFGDSSISILHERVKASLPILGDLGEVRLKKIAFDADCHSEIQRASFDSALSTIETVFGKQRNYAWCKIESHNGTAKMTTYNDDNKQRSVEVILGPSTGDARVIVDGLLFKAVIEAMPNSTLKFQLKNDFPVIVESNGDGFYVYSAVAPRVEDK